MMHIIPPIIIGGVMLFALKVVAVAGFVLSSYSSVAVASATEEALAAKAVADAVAEKDQLDEISKHLFPLIEQTQLSMEESLGTVRSDLAIDLTNETKSLFADPVVYKSLLHNANSRQILDMASREPSFYAAETLSAFHSSLKLTPGIMGDDALITRARLIAEIAKFYSTTDSQMCRYLPSDFSILMNIDAPWLVRVEPELFHQALEDEKAAVKLMLTGVLPRHVNASDKQVAFSRFAKQWLSGLDEESRYKLASAKISGNYCDIWSAILTDLVSMSDNYPETTRKITAPFLVMMSRGWLDAGLWSYKVQEDSN
jgi:hypothetical protein